MAARPSIDAPITLIDGDRRVETRVAGVDGHLVIVPRPTERLKGASVVMRWVDPTTRQPLEAEAMPTPLAGSAFLGLAPLEQARVERRAHRRYPAPRGVSVEARRITSDGKGALVRGPLTDVSAGGIASTSATLIEAGTEVEVTVRNTARSSYLRSRRCVVASVRQQSGRYVIGLDLRTASSGERGLASLVEDAILQQRPAA